MTIHHHRIARIVLAAVTAAVGMSLWGGGAANAAGLTLQYQCSLPPFPDQPMTARLTWNQPDSVLVGQNTPVIPVTATATLGDTVTQGLGFIGATTVEGSVDTAGVVVAPEGNLPASLPLTVPRTDVPASGPITVTANGATPVFVFHRTGHATITVDSGLTVHLLPRDASGNPTIAGQVDASCTLDPGQNDVLTSFEITAPIPAATGGSAGSPTGRTTRTATPATPATAPTGQRTPAPGTSTGVTSSDIPGTGSTTSATTTRDLAVATASIVRRDIVDPRLVGAGFLVVGTALLGCVWWLVRRRGH
jgi:hypothetical protein